MKSKIKIDQLVDETLESVSKIDSVKVPPFFKDKVLQRMAQQRLPEEEVVGIRYLDWFTPKYQAAALICFVVLNMAVLFSNADTTENYTDEVSNFAEVYGISTSDSNTIIY